MHYIVVQKRKYYYHDKYLTWKEALKDGKHFKKKHKTLFFILKSHDGIVFPYTKYKLYLTKPVNYL